jgi:hypothetical protein
MREEKGGKGGGLRNPAGRATTHRRCTRRVRSSSFLTRELGVYALEAAKSCCLSKVSVVSDGATVSGPWVGHGTALLKNSYRPPRTTPSCWDVYIDTLAGGLDHGAATAVAWLCGLRWCACWCQHRCWPGARSSSRDARGWHVCNVTHEAAASAAAWQQRRSTHPLAVPVATGTMTHSPKSMVRRCVCVCGLLLG